MMKRLTIGMSEELYTDLLEFAADESKKKVRRLSLGRTVRALISAQLKQSGYERATVKPGTLDVTARQAA